MATKKRGTKKKSAISRGKKKAPVKRARAKRAAKPRAKIAARPKKKAAARRTAPKKKAKRVAKPAAKPAVRRRDGSGHLDPAYAAKLRSLSEEGATRDDDRAFVSGGRSDDDLAEDFGEEAVEQMTSGEGEAADVRDEVVAEEQGGPFIVTSGNTEFAEGTDASNPKGSSKEPFPRT